MKAIVKNTGEIVDVNLVHNPEDFSCYFYINTVTKREYSPMELNFGSASYSSKKEDNSIDWEQRRYEIAKDVLSGLEVNSESKIEADCKLAIELADEMIKQLKNK